MADEEDYWFEPKRYGYGAGLPSAWQGWVLVLCYYLLIALAILLFAERSLALLFAIVLPATFVFCLIARHKTRGGWRWRWGERDDPGGGDGSPRRKRRS